MEVDGDNDILLAIGQLRDELSASVSGLNARIQQVETRGGQGAAGQPGRPNYMRMEDGVRPFDAKDKDSKLTSWVNELFGMAMEYGWDTEMTHRKALRAVSGAIHDTLQSVKVRPEMTVLDLKRCYLQTFLGDKDDLKVVQRVYKSYSQEIDESVDSYRLRLERMFDRALPSHKTNEEMAFFVARTFVAGLRDELLFMAVAPEKFRTMEAAHEFCKERVKLGDSLRERPVKSEQAKALVAASGTPMEVDAVRDAAKVKCFNCGKMGHLKRNCRVPQKKEATKKDQFKKWRKPSKAQSTGVQVRKKKPFFRKRIQELQQQMEEMEEQMEAASDEERDSDEESPINDKDFH